MNPFALITNLERRGMALLTDGPVLWVEPCELLTDVDREAIRTLKPQLHALVKLRAYELRCRGVARMGRRGIRHLTILHAKAQHVTGEHLTLSGEPLPMKYKTCDCGAAYRSEEGQRIRAQEAQQLARYVSANYALCVRKTYAMCPLSVLKNPSKALKH